MASDRSYARSMEGWNRDAVPMPTEYVEAGYEGDPSLSGFTLINDWKRAEGNPVRAGWLYAVTSGHTEIAAADPIDVPLLLHAAEQTYHSEGDEWDPQLLMSDAVLTTKYLVAAGSTLSTDVTIKRRPMRHDPFLSLPDVRQAVWHDFHAWSARTLPGLAPSPDQLGEAATYAICP